MIINPVSLSFPERKIKQILRNIIFKKGRLKCPRCNCFKILSIRNEDRYFCKRCRKKFSILSNTWMRNIKIPLSAFIILLYLWLEDASVDLTKKLTGLSRPTIYSYFRLFRRNIVKTIEFKPRDNVQVDEAYFGRIKKQANRLHNWNTYKTPIKVCVAGIACPQTGQLATRVIESRPGKPIKTFIREYVPNDITVYSDGSPIYTELKKTHWHVPKTHDLGFHDAYYIESCWSWMKRKLFKQYHHFSKKYAKEYVSELTFKFNTRKIEKNPFYYISKSL